MSPDARPVVVEAAGGLVTIGDGTGVRVLVVHRPRWDDWTLPKGKLERGETLAEAAVREVEEESGLRCELVGEPCAVSYTDHKGRPKRVTYWRMRVAGGEFAPNREVDRVDWLSPEQARSALTYDADRQVLDELR